MKAATAARRLGSLVRPSLAEVLLIAVGVSLLVSGGRLFSDWSFLTPLVGAILISHLVAGFVRRAGGTVALGAALSLLAVAGEQLWLHYAHTTRYGLPQEATFRSLADDFSGAWDLLRDASVPLAPQTGLLVPLAAVAWAVAVLGDWAAFRLAARGEALLPAGIVFVLVAVFGTDEGRILYPAITVACAVAFSLAHRSEQAPARREPPSVTRRRPRWPRGLATGTLTVAGGLLVTGALLPTLSGGPLGSWLEPGDEPSAPVVQVVLSPLAGVPGQLLENPELELFTVQSPQRAYWRLTALGSFDGFVWSLEGRHSAATDRLESSSTTAAPVTVVPQTYSIRALAAVWLPAAYQPTEFVTEGTPFEARFEPVSSTLLVSSSVASSNGFDYTVKSAVPRFDPAFLRSLSNDQAVVDETFLAVPQNLDGALGELAADVIEGRDGPYEQALALQNWFRDNFEYDLAVDPGHSSSRLDTFLLVEQRGYCEQFAGAFAVLGRTLGLPTRVAVGFTPGVVLAESQPAGTLYSVRGEHAHAWPEVYIDGAGWVAFEPTPGRGAPGAEGYTLVPEQQDSPGPSQEPALAPPPPPTSPPQPPGAESPDPAPRPDTAGTADQTWEDTTLRVLAFVGLSLAALLGAGVLYATATAGLASLQRRPRWRWARRYAERSTIAAWEDVMALLWTRRIGPRPAETPLEVAQRAAESLGPAPEPWHRLALCVSVAAYAGGPMPASIDRQAADAAGEISSALRSGRTIAQWLRDLCDPYPWQLLLRRGSAGAHHRGHRESRPDGRRATGVSRRVARG